MSETYKLSIEKDYLIFATGHFITYGGRCETLHGHNYRARVELEGTLDEDAYVIDFSVVKRIMRELVDELDHRMLLPTENPKIAVTEDGDSIRAVYEEKNREYRFPRSDVKLLAVPNTTAEMLARHLTQRLRTELRELGATNITSIAVEVEESFGQSAQYRQELTDG